MPCTSSVMTHVCHLMPAAPAGVLRLIPSPGSAAPVMASVNQLVVVRLVALCGEPIGAVIHYVCVRVYVGVCATSRVLQIQLLMCSVAAPPPVPRVDAI
jgi:hypothetical protein